MTAYSRYSTSLKRLRANAAPEDRNSEAFRAPPPQPSRFKVPPPPPLPSPISEEELIEWCKLVGFDHVSAVDHARWKATERFNTPGRNNKLLGALRRVVERTGLLDRSWLLVPDADIDIANRAYVDWIVSGNPELELCCAQVQVTIASVLDYRTRQAAKEARADG